jgi:hypothetical protein
VRGVQLFEGIGFVSDINTMENPLVEAEYTDEEYLFIKDLLHRFEFDYSFHETIDSITVPSTLELTHDILVDVDRFIFEVKVVKKSNGFLLTFAQNFFAQ